MNRCSHFVHAQAHKIEKERCRHKKFKTPAIVRSLKKDSPSSVNVGEALLTQFSERTMRRDAEMNSLFSFISNCTMCCHATLVHSCHVLSRTSWSPSCASRIFCIRSLAFAHRSLAYETETASDGDLVHDAFLYTQSLFPSV